MLNEAAVLWKTFTLQFSIFMGFDKPSIYIHGAE